MAHLCFVSRLQLNRLIPPTYTDVPNLTVIAIGSGCHERSNQLCSSSAPISDCGCTLLTTAYVLQIGKVTTSYTRYSDQFWLDIYPTWKYRIDINPRISAVIWFEGPNSIIFNSPYLSYKISHSKILKSQQMTIKVHGASMGPTWVLSAPDGPHDGLMNLAIRDHSVLVSHHPCLKSRGRQMEPTG